MVTRAGDRTLNLPVQGGQQEAEGQNSQQLTFSSDVVRITLRTKTQRNLKMTSHSILTIVVSE